MLFPCRGSLSGCSRCLSPLIGIGCLEMVIDLGDCYRLPAWGPTARSFCSLPAPLPDPRSFLQTKDFLGQFPTGSPDSLIGIVILRRATAKRSYGADELGWGLFPQCEYVRSLLRLSGPSLVSVASRVGVKH